MPALLKRIKGAAASVCLHVAPDIETDCLVQGTSRQAFVKEEEEEDLHFQPTNQVVQMCQGCQNTWSKLAVLSVHDV